MQCCIICKEGSSVEELVSIKQLRGANNINDAAKKRGANITASVGSLVHSGCRTNFVNKKSSFITQGRKSC